MANAPSVASTRSKRLTSIDERSKTISCANPCRGVLPWKKRNTMRMKRVRVCDVRGSIQTFHLAKNEIFKTRTDENPSPSCFGQFESRIHADCPDCIGTLRHYSTFHFGCRRILWGWRPRSWRRLKPHTSQNHSAPYSQRLLTQNNAALQYKNRGRVRWSVDGRRKKWTCTTVPNRHYWITA